MPYIGKSPVGGGFHKLDNLTASATATYALTLGSAAYYPETANQLLVSLNGVIQAPQDSFTVSGSNLIFDSALTASDSIDFVVALGDVLGVQGVTDGTVSTNKIANGAVTSAKLATNIDIAGTLDVTGALTVDSGIYLGGTGAANYLTDYEEGTWTPVDYWGAVSIAVYAANYTKIGRKVFFELGIGIPTNSSSNPLRITGLPFNAIGGGDDTSGAYVIGTNSGRADLFLVSRGNNYIAANTNSNTDVYFSNYSNKQLKLCGSYTTT